MTKFHHLFFLLLIFILIGCSHNKAGHSSMNNAQTITLTESGGFTGAVTGYTFHSNGNIEQWEQKPGQEKTIKNRYTVKKKNLNTLFQQFDQNVLAFEHNQTGNMTTTVTLTSPEETHKWSWRGSGQMASIPKELSEIYKQLQDTISNL